MPVLTLASSSEIRARLLGNAGISHAVVPARIDESALTESLLAEEATPRDIADALAEHKALKVWPKAKTGLVLGCDQILECDGQLLSKPANKDEAREQLTFLRGRTHRLHTAAVLLEHGRPVWRHVSVPRLTMRDFSPAWLDSYIETSWNDIRHCVGGYQIESLGVQLFSRIDGDLFSIQGLPLLELLDILIRRGDLQQ